MVDALREREVACSVISFDGWRRGAPRRPVPAADGVLRLTGPEQLDDAVAWGRARDPAIVHVHDPLLFDAAAEIAGDRPVVLSLHVLAHHQDRLRGLDAPSRSAAAQRRAISAAAAILAPSSSVAEILERDFPDASSRIVRAPLAADDDEGARAAADPRADRPATGALLFCGRFADMSGVDALPEVARALDGGQLVVAGGLPDNRRADRRWRARLEHPAIRLTGWLDRAALDRERAAADALIAPVRFATFGMAVLEAMLAGLPVAAYRAGGVAELVVDGVTGVLVDPGDRAALIDAARSLLADRDRALELGASGRRRALEHYSWKARIAPVIELYRRLVRGR